MYAVKFELPSCVSIFSNFYASNSPQYWLGIRRENGVWTDGAGATFTEAILPWNSAPAANENCTKLASEELELYAADCDTESLYVACSTFAACKNTNNPPHPTHTQNSFVIRPN